MNLKYIALAYACLLSYTLVIFSFFGPQKPIGRQSVGRPTQPTTTPVKPRFSQGVIKPGGPNFLKAGKEETLRYLQGPVIVVLNNTSWRDLMIGADCKDNPDAFISLPRNGVAKFRITLGKTCKIYAAEDATQNPRQSIICLDQYGCEIPNCQGTGLDCSQGSCDNLGLKWVRGGNASYKEFLSGSGDTCIRQSQDNFESQQEHIYYGIVNTQ